LENSCIAFLGQILARNRLPAQKAQNFHFLFLFFTNLFANKYLYGEEFYDGDHN
jgi:hypothetical protein